MRLVASLSAAALAMLVATLGGHASRATGRVVTYPAPVGEAISTEFSAKVKPLGGAWKPLDVYWVVVNPETHSNSGFVEFDSRGPVQVSITKRSGNMRSALVRPRSYGIKAVVSRDGRTATFTLPRPLNVSFEPNGDRLHNVQVFVNSIERNVPRPGPHVIFFGPGVHRIPGDHVLDVPSNTTVYIAGGAVVKGALAIKDARNVIVRGHGILDPLLQFRSTIKIDDSSNIGVRDLTLRRAQNGGVNITDSKDVVIANIREINLDRYADGVDVAASSDVLIDNVFLRTSDDSIAVSASTPYGGHGSTRNVVVRDSILWADNAHPILVGPFGNPAGGDVVEHVDFQNVDILEHDERYPLYQGAMAVNAGDNLAIRDVRFDNMRVDDFARGQLVNVRVFLNPSYNKRPGASVDHVLFRNIDFDGHGDHPSQIEGYGPARQVTNVVFEDLNRDGGTVLDPGAGNIAIGPYTSDVLFRTQPAATTLDDRNGAIRYSGRWRRSGSMHVASSPGSRATLTFTGQQARVYGLTSPRSGRVDVYVDGSYTTTIDTYSLVGRTQQIWFDTGVLASGTHTLELRCRGSKNILSTSDEIGLDKFEIVS